MFESKKPALAIAAAALALSFSVAQAAPTHQDGPWHQRFEQQMKQLHQQLKLNPDQEKLWQSAVGLMKTNRQAEHANRQQFHKQIEAARQQPILDLNALNDMQQKRADESRQSRQQVTAAWLNFYNSLDNNQKTLVSTALKKRWARGAQWREKMHERMERHHPVPASAPAAQ